jgi:uncharacterized protein with HEPN domain
MKSRRGNIQFALSPETRALRDRVERLASKTTVREWLTRSLLPGGVSPNRADKSPARMLEIINRYPGLYRHADTAPGSSAPPFSREGFAIDAGWLGIVERLSASLAADPNLVVGQLKEKMGLLTVYFEPSELSSPEIEAATDRALEEARTESRRTCEICGAPGVLAKRRHTVGVRCQSCETPTNLVERLARDLLPCGYPPDRKTMTPAHQLELIRHHPGLYRLATEPLALPYEPFGLDGFAVGDGWHGIIERLSVELAADPSLVTVQVKEKDGVLKFHVTERVGAKSAAAIEAARGESERTCEICGAPGEIAARLRGWVSVRCVPCESLDDMEEACRRLADYAGSRDLASFESDENAVDASMLALIHLGEGAHRQSPERRAKFSGINWRQLDSFRAMTGVAETPSMTAAEIWAFAKNEAPGLAEALR